MNQEIVQIISDFNDTLLSLATNLADVRPTSIIGTNIKDIEKVFRRKDNFTKFIDLFSIRVLRYKDDIDDGNDNFFMHKDYAEDLNDCDSSYLNHVISLKSIWQELKVENRQIVILNMQLLCALAQQYLEYVVSTMDKKNKG